MISPEGQTQVGPFPCERTFGACIEEIVKHFTYACVLFSAEFQSDHAEVVAAKARFLGTYANWKRQYLPTGGG